MRTPSAHPVILAGGFGTRLQHVLQGVPKPMAPVRGRPFVEWVVRWLRRAGFEKATVTTGFLGETIEAHFAARPVPGIEVTCLREAAPLGTGGAFARAARQPGPAPDAWLVLNGDSLIGVDPADALRRFHDAGADAALVARRVDAPGRYGVLGVGPGGRLRSFSEKAPAGAGPALVNAGVYLIRHGLAARLPGTAPLSFEFDVFPGWLRAGVAVAVLDADAPFLDIGTEESLAQADRFVADNRGLFS